MQTTEARPAIPTGTPAPRLSGYCQGDDTHALCNGGVLDAVPRLLRDGNGKLLVHHVTRTVVCPCGCHADRPRACLRCRYRETRIGEVDATRLTCLDREACADRCADRQARNPLHLQLVEVIRDGEVERIRSRLEAATRRERNIVPKVETTTPDAPAPTEAKPARIPKPKTGACHHCGATTKGGLFVAGHDAKLKGELQKAAYDPDGRKADRVTAAAEMLARSWNRKPLPEDIAAEAQAQVDRTGREKLIAVSADRRKDRHAQPAA